METKKFGKVIAFLLGIFAVLGIGMGVMNRVMTPTVSVSWNVEKEPVKAISLDKNVPPAVVEMVDFVDQKLGISFSYPKNFYIQKDRDGKYAYQAYFTSDNIRNDFRRLGADNVQLTATVFKKGWIDGKKVKELMTQGMASVEERTSVMVDGVSAVQERVLVLTDDPGCDIRTYFTKSGVSYELSLFSPGKTCEVVKKFSMEYTATLSSFRVGEQKKKVE